MIEIYFKNPKDEEFQLIENFRKGSWIHVEEASLEDLQLISQFTGIDTSDLQDCLDKYETPRIEKLAQYLLIFLRYPSEEEEGLYTSTVTVLLVDDYLITISPQKSKWISTFLHHKPSLSTTQKSTLFLALFQKIAQDFATKIKAVRYGNTILAQEGRSEQMTNNTIILLTKNEDVLNQYLSALVPLRNLIESLASGRSMKLLAKEQEFLQDLLIAIRQSEDLCFVNVKSIRSLRDSYQILFTNAVTKTIKFLTAITIIFTIPSIIGTFFGMNINVPFEKNPFAFLIIINITIVLTILSVILFIRKKWL